MQLKPLKKHTQTRNSERGASLVYALVVISMLTLIGLSLASFAVMGIRLAQMDATNDRAFYLSDAAVEETLYKIEALAHDADAAASAWVAGKTFENQTKWQVFTTKLERDVANGVITQAQSAEYLKTAYDWEYNKYYNFVLQGSPVTSYNTDTTWLTSDYTLVNNDQYVTQNTLTFKNNNLYNSQASGLTNTTMQSLNTLNLDPAQYATLLSSYKSTGKPAITVTSTYNSNVCTLEVNSNGAYNSAHKTIKMSIGMEAPKYSQIVSVTSSKTQVKRNQLLDNALTAGRNIIVSDNTTANPGNVKTTYVDGNVYAYGDFPETLTYSIPSLGGVMSGYESSSDVLNSGVGPFVEGDLTGTGKLAINGDLVTRSAVSLMNNQSTLAVTGSTYADGFVATKDSLSTSFETKKDLVLMEDLVLNGANPVVQVGDWASDPSSGAIWGLLDYDISSMSNTKKSDLSSSVIVNTDSNAPKITCNYFRVGGVAYYSVYRVAYDANNVPYWKAYKTGESFTTNNQSTFYQTGNPDTAINSGMFNYNIFGNYEYPNTTNQSNPGTVGLIEYMDKDGNIKEDTNFKATHFFTIGQTNPGAVSNRDKNILKVNSIDVVRDSNKNFLYCTGLSSNYGLGVTIANGTVFSPFYSDKDNNNNVVEFMRSDIFKNGKINMIESFDAKAHLLKTRDMLKMTNDNANNRFNQLMDTTQAPVINVSDNKRFTVVNPVEAGNGANPVNVYINIPDSMKATIEAKDPKAIIIPEVVTNDPGSLNRTIYGFVVTKGNIFLYNNNTSSPLYLRGTLVADQNIVFMGPGEKHVVYDENYIYSQVAKEDVLGATFYKSTGKKAIVLNKTNSSSLTSTLDGDLAVGVADYTSVVNVSFTNKPNFEGSTKKESPFTFKIIQWSLDH